MSDNFILVIPAEVFANRYGLSKNKSKSEYDRERHLDKTFGMTVADYDIMLDKQNGVCAICCLPEKTGRRLCIDHNHKTGKVRGLLCTHCNTSIGHFKDDVSLLQSAISYLIDQEGY